MRQKLNNFFVSTKSKIIIYGTKNIFYPYILYVGFKNILFFFIFDSHVEFLFALPLVNLMVLLLAFTWWNGNEKLMGKLYRIQTMANLFLLCRVDKGTQFSNHKKQLIV
jgi:hypothetical protein